MAITRQETVAASLTATTTHSVVLGGVNTGDLLVIVFRPETTLANISSLPAGALLAVSDNETTSGVYCTGIWYLVAPAGQSTTITFTTSVSVLSMLWVGRYTGVDTLDKAPAATDSAGTGLSEQTASTGTLSVAVELAIAVCGVSGNTTSETATGGFTVLDAASLNRLMVAELIVAATTALQPTFNWVSARERHAMIATFLLAYKFAGGVNVGLSVPAAATTLAVGAEV